MKGRNLVEALAHSSAKRTRLLDSISATPSLQIQNGNANDRPAAVGKKANDDNPEEREPVGNGIVHPTQHVQRCHGDDEQGRTRKHQLVNLGDLIFMNASDYYGNLNNVIEVRRKARELRRPLRKRKWRLAKKLIKLGKKSSELIQKARSDIAIKQSAAETLLTTYDDGRIRLELTTRSGRRATKYFSW